MSMNKRLPKSNEHLRLIPDYVVSDSVEDVADRYGLSEVTYLASNENPFGCSPSVNEAIVQAASNIHRYPDGAGRELKGLISSHLGLPQESVVLGNGSNEVLELVAKVFLSESKELLISEHSFAMYPIFGLSLGSQVKMVSMNSWCVDLDAMLSAVTEKTKVIYVANANNPTGTMLPFGELRSFLERVPAQTVVVIDEAYIEFADDHHQSMVSLVTEFSNLVVSRTFSKAYGLAGLRVGYGLANVELISLLEKMRQPFNVNAIALSAAAAAYKDQGFLKKVVQHNLIERAKIESTLDHLGLKYLPSQTNFLAIELPDCAAFCIEFLQSQGVIIRSLKSYQMQNWFRLSVGLEQENRLFITKLKEFLGESIDE